MSKTGITKYVRVRDETNCSRCPSEADAEMKDGIQGVLCYRYTAQYRMGYPPTWECTSLRAHPTGVCPCGHLHWRPLRNHTLLSWIHILLWVLQRFLPSLSLWFAKNFPSDSSSAHEFHLPFFPRATFRSLIKLLECWSGHTCISFIDHLSLVGWRTLVVREPEIRP